MDNKEIERKFLLAVLPEGLSAFSLINQGYLAVDADGNEVRLRDESGQYSEAAKNGRGKVRRQYETSLNERQFYRLWPATDGGRLRKERRRKPYLGLTIEVDRYLDRLSGLIMAEVEFKDETSCKNFIPPDWFGLEVTDRPEYYSQNLALYGLPTCFAEDLKKLTEGQNEGR